MDERFDKDLRIKFNGKINFDFESFENCLPDSPDLIENMKRDCASAYNRKDDAVDTKEAGISDTDYAAEGCTYFQKANEPARCWPEELALAIFRKHTKDAQFDPATSGAEWWTMVVNSEADIGFHWDRDYGLEGASGYNVHPHLGSVTYLTANGAPTVVLNKLGELLSEDDHTGEADQMVVSRPKVGKHIKFDGRLLHAAPADLLTPDPTMRGVKRVTFLVNVWLNNIPLQTKRYPEHAISEFVSPPMVTNILQQKWGKATGPSEGHKEGPGQGQVSGTAIPFDLSAVLKAKRQNSDKGSIAAAPVATFSAKHNSNSSSNSTHLKGKQFGKSPSSVVGVTTDMMLMSTPDITVSSQLAMRTKYPLVQMREWTFVNGGCRYKVLIPLPAVDRLQALCKENYSFNLKYEGSGLVMSLVNLDLIDKDTEEDDEKDDEEAQYGRGECYQGGRNRKKRRKSWKPMHSRLTK